MFNVGRVCMKIAGRDAGRMCVIVDVLDARKVLIDGDVRRRNCNPVHLEPLNKTLTLKKGASHGDVEKAFSEAGYAVWNTKPKKAGERPVKARGAKKESAPAKAKPKKEKAAPKKASEKKAVAVKEASA